MPAEVGALDGLRDVNLIDVVEAQALIDGDEAIAGPNLPGDSGEFCGEVGAETDLLQWAESVIPDTPLSRSSDQPEGPSPLMPYIA